MRRIRFPSIRFPPIRFAGEGTVNAPPEIVWDILTDYRNGQPQLFPMAYRRRIISERWGILRTNAGEHAGTWARVA